MAAYTYRHLDADDKTAVEESMTAEPQPDLAALIPAWEADHYAHSLLAAQTDGDEKKQHEAAMKQIEAAIKAAAV